MEPHHTTTPLLRPNFHVPLVFVLTMFHCGCFFIQQIVVNRSCGFIRTVKTDVRARVRCEYQQKCRRFKDSRQLSGMKWPLKAEPSKFSSLVQASGWCFVSRNTKKSRNSKHPFSPILHSLRGPPRKNQTKMIFFRQGSKIEILSIFAYK